MSKADKLRETFGGSRSDTLRIWAIDFLEQINIAVGGGGGGALATEATLISVLNAIVASDQDIEILLVRDTGNGDVVLQQITNYETGVPVVTYKDVDGNVVVPVGPLEYLDPSAVLQLVLAELVILATPVTGLAMGIVRATDATGSPIAAGKRKIAVMNVGDADGDILGGTDNIKPGETMTWKAEERDTLADFSYDGTGTELVIITVG